MAAELKHPHTHEDVDPPPSTAFYTRFSSWFEHKAEKWSYSFAFKVATNPKKFLVGMVLFLIVCCLGLLKTQTQTDGDKLWVPTNSQSTSSKNTIEEYYGLLPDYATVIISVEPGSNVLTTAILAQTWDLYQAAVDVGLTLQQACDIDLATGTCNMDGLLNIWNFDRTIYDGQVTDDASLLTAVSVTSYPDGQPVNRATIMGGIVENADGSIASAEGFQISFSLYGHTGTTKSYESSFQDLMASTIIVGAELFYITSRSIDDELARSVGGEFYLFALTYIIMTAFVTALLGPLDRVKGRKGLAITGVMLVALSGAAAYGICGLAGVPFSSLELVLPFILLGIGIDDMFITVDCYMGIHDASLTVEEKVATAMSHCGLSILFSTAVNVVSFLLGTLSSIPAISAFCWYSAAGVAFDYISQMTAFVAMVTMDAHREASGRLDLVCCKKPRPKETIINGETEEVQAPKPLKATKLARAYAEWLLSPVGMAVGLLSTSILLAVSIWGLTKVQEGFDVKILVPDDSYVNGYIDEATALGFWDNEAEIDLGLYFEGVDMSDTTVQSEALILTNDVLAIKYSRPPLDSWLEQFLAWSQANATYAANIDANGLYASPTTFMPALNDFLADPSYSRHISDIIFTDDGSEIAISRVFMFEAGITEVSASKDALKTYHSTTQNSYFGGDQSFTFTQNDFNSEQDLIISSELLQNIALILPPLFFFCIIFLGRMRYSLLTCGVVVVAHFELLSFIYFWGLQINAVTAIELIMSTGLITDYNVHLSHYFTVQDRSLSQKERMIEAMAEIVPSVFLGASTTFLGIIPLALAKNAIFRTFFRLFVAIIFVGGFHGLIFMPIAIVLMPDGPVPWFKPKGKGKGNIVVDSKEIETTEIKQPAQDTMSRMS